MAKRYTMNPDDPRTGLRENVVRALRAIPLHFSSPISIEGMLATDLFSLNSMLGGAIEENTVIALNNNRVLWDPENKYPDYSFRRYPESFPDVRLESDNTNMPLIGIELKGWYLLAKEQQPSFRFRASANAMTEWDLIAVFPWSLSNVLSGQPKILSPFIEQAKYAADLRTEYWENRGTSTKVVVNHPNTTPYPAPGSQYSDSVTDDTGGNFGRIARISGLMDDWISHSMDQLLLGIEAKWWVQFLKMFSEKNDERAIRKKFVILAEKAGHDEYWAEEVFERAMRLIEMGQ